MVMPVMLVESSRGAASLKNAETAGLSGAIALIKGKFKEHGISGLASGLSRFVGVMLTWRQHQALVETIDQPQTRAIRARFPRVQYRYTLPYLSTSLDWHERWSALKSHYEFVNQTFCADFSQRVLDDRLEIWREEREGQNLSVHIQGLCPVTRHREGELTLCFKMGGMPIYKMSFSFVRWSDLGLARISGVLPGDLALYVGRVQGVSGTMTAIRAATALLGDVAPQDLLMSVLSGLAQALGVNQVIGVSDETCVSCDTIALSDSSFSYLHFWSRYNAQQLTGGHNLVSLPVAEKPLSEISAKHRKRTQRKRDFKRQVAAQSELALRKVLA